MRAFLLAAILIIPACALSGSDDGVDQQEAGGTQYVDIVDFPNIDAVGWYGLSDTLRGELAAQYPNIMGLSFNCSVTSKIGNVHDCALTLASSQAAVDGSNAAISVDAVTYQCHVHPKTTAAKLVPLLTGSSDVLHQVLPGTGSIADTLADCFAHPIGGTALPPPSSGTTYVEASAYYATATYQAKWQAAKTALVGGFDDVCGDTFCGSDFGDLRSLQIVCAITKSSGNVKGCSWVFGGSYSLPATNGALAVTSQNFRCDFSMHGTLPQLITVLTAAGTDSPIKRALPGTTATAYDALGGCLP
jgi:hypothetical protein